MESSVTTESGLQLLARLCKRPSLLNLDNILFPEGPEPGDIIQISGHSSVGKSLLLLKFITKSLLPKSYMGVDIGGLEAGVILINTDHNISILKLVTLMEEFIYNASIGQFDKEKSKILRKPDVPEKIIIESLKQLIILNTYSSMQLEMNFQSLEKILSGNSNMSLIIIDSLTSYYWSDITNLKSIKKMDLYLKVMIDKLKKCIEEYKLVTIFVTQEYFQCKQSEFSSSLIKHKVELKKNEDSDVYFACIDSENGVYSDGCGYKNKFDEFSAAIKSALPDVDITSKHGSIGSFEVTVNDVLVFSKLRTMAFPDNNDAVEVCRSVSDGMPPRDIKRQESSSWCTIA